MKDFVYKFVVFSLHLYETIHSITKIFININLISIRVESLDLSH